MPHLHQILIYPIKALDGMAVEQATLLESGAIQNDRRFAIFDVHGRYVNGKNNALVHNLRATYDLAAQTVTLQGSTFPLIAHHPELEQYLSDYFGEQVYVRENRQTGFPDDIVAQGPTVISTATIETLASWFDGISTDQARSRLRMNLEIGNVPAFWEDQLFGEEHQTVEFQIGEVRFQGINPCQRCVVPTRNATTGDPYPKFQQIFIQKRRQTLPNWTNPDRFNHYYRLGVNTQLSPKQGGKILSRQDSVQRLGVL
jgi:hypothetical protein